jgi:ATP-dependent Clp protease ATP-binding subunit ClpA
LSQASLVARVSTIIPFLPFSWEERLAISSKCLTALQRNVALSDPSALVNVPQNGWKGIMESAAGDYMEAEGARSIHRGILRLADAVLHGVST